MLVATTKISYKDGSSKIINVTAQSFKDLTTPKKDGRGGFPSNATLRDIKMKKNDWIQLCKRDKWKALYFQMLDIAFDDAKGKPFNLEVERLNQ